MWIVGKILDQYFNRWLFWWGISTKPANLFFLQAGCYPEDTFKTQIQTRKGDKFSGKMALSKNVGPRHPKTWLVVWNMVFIFPFSWECHHPNWLSLIFFRGVGQPPTSPGLFFGRIQRIFQTKFLVWAISKKTFANFWISIFQLISWISKL